MEVDDALPLSGLQHLAFCTRQWALIHLEQAWAENRLTAEGRLLHERADLPGQSRRADLRTVRGMLLHSLRLRLTGRADVVEFRPEPFPVEYKRGKRKPTDCDLVQLCAQALCLEDLYSSVWLMRRNGSPFAQACLPKQFRRQIAFAFTSWAQNGDGASNMLVQRRRTTRKVHSFCRDGWIGARTPSAR